MPSCVHDSTVAVKREMAIWKTSFSMRIKHGRQRSPVKEDYDLIPRVASSHTWRTCLHLRLKTPDATCLVLDGAAIMVKMMKPTAAKIFDEYAQQVFIPYISSHLRSVSRVDLVWDTYKGTATAKRGKVLRWLGKPPYQATGRTFCGLTATRRIIQFPVHGPP